MRSIKQLLKTPLHNEAVTVRGWLRSARQSKRVGFLSINDGSTATSLQAVVPIALSGDSGLGGKGIDWKRLTFGASVQVTGELVPSPGGKQDVELQVTECKVIGDADSSFPLQKKYSTAEHLRAHAHLRPRTVAAAAILRLQSHIIASIGRYFSGAGFFQTLPPVLTSSDCEGAGEVFRVAGSDDFFRKPAFLAVSTQLHLECLAAGVGRVWTLAPTFRAERSLTARHLAEFRMLEAELCFTHGLGDVMDVVEGLVKHVVADLARTDSPAAEDLAAMRSVTAENIDSELDLRARWAAALGGGVGPGNIDDGSNSAVHRQPWPRIRYAEAVRILNDSGVQFAYSPNDGLQTEHELYLTQHFDGPVFVTHYPRAQKPFYMSTSRASPTGAEAECDGGAGEAGEASEEVAECFDLLVPSMGELCGGSLRDSDASALLARMEASGMDTEAMRWYVDLRTYGTVPHGGFGIGFERLVGYLTGVQNVREVAAFPRYVNHCVA